jgi:outer membrane biosynthesis protein TonB
MLNKKHTNQRPAAFSEKQPVSLFILICLLVVLVHLTAIRWLGNPQNMSTNNNQPIPFKLEVSLLTKNSPQSIAAPPTQNPTPKPVAKPEPELKQKPKPKPEQKSETKTKAQTRTKVRNKKSNSNQRKIARPE